MDTPSHARTHSQPPFAAAVGVRIVPANNKTLPAACEPLREPPAVSREESVVPRCHLMTGSAISLPLQSTLSIPPARNGATLSPSALPVPQAAGDEQVSPPDGVVGQQQPDAEKMEVETAPPLDCQQISNQHEDFMFLESVDSMNSVVVVAEGEPNGEWEEGTVAERVATAPCGKMPKSASPSTGKWRAPRGERFCDVCQHEFFDRSDLHRHYRSSKHTLALAALREGSSSGTTKPAASPGSTNRPVPPQSANSVNIASPTKLTKILRDRFCDVCQLEFDYPYLLGRHLQTEIHRSNLAAQQGNGARDTAAVSTATTKPLASTVSRPAPSSVERKEFYCEVCQLDCFYSSMYSSHIRSAQHARVLDPLVAGPTAPKGSDAVRVWQKDRYCHICQQGFVYPCFYKRHVATDPQHLEAVRAAQGRPGSAAAGTPTATATAGVASVVEPQEAAVVDGVETSHRATTNVHCDICDQTFNIREFDMHMRTVKHALAVEAKRQGGAPESTYASTAARKEVSCDLCEHTYGTRRDYLRHCRTLKHLDAVRTQGRDDLGSHAEKTASPPLMKLADLPSPSTLPCGDSNQPTSKGRLHPDYCASLNHDEKEGDLLQRPGEQVPYQTGTEPRTATGAHAAVAEKRSGASLDRTCDTAGKTDPASQPLPPSKRTRRTISRGGGVEGDLAMAGQIRAELRAIQAEINADLAHIEASRYIALRLCCYRF